MPAFKLVEAGFSQPQVEALSEFMQMEAAHRSDLIEVEHRLETKMADVKAEVAEVKATQRLHNWMIGFNIGLTLIVLGKLFLAH